MPEATLGRMFTSYKIVDARACQQRVGKEVYAKREKVLGNLQHAAALLPHDSGSAVCDTDPLRPEGSSNTLKP